MLNLLSTFAPAYAPADKPTGAAPKPRKPRAPAKPRAVAPAKPAKPTVVASDDKPSDAALIAAALAKRNARNLARDAATITANRTNFGGETDRDAAYLTFFGAIARKLGTDTITLAQIADHGVTVAGKACRNPFYAGSAKATDAGAINRAAKSGTITKSTDGSAITITARGQSAKAYSAGKL
jgi:hypothetical protein